MSKKNVHTLASDTNHNLIIIGIASHENDYRISWALNSTLELKFVKADNFQSFHKRFAETQEFSMYINPENDTFPLCKLISNRCDNGFLIEELRNLDYILLLENNENKLDKNWFIQQLRTIPFISTAFEINPATVKSIGRII